MKSKLMLSLAVVAATTLGLHGKTVISDPANTSGLQTVAPVEQQVEQHLAGTNATPAHGQIMSATPIDKDNSHQVRKAKYFIGSRQLNDQSRVPAVKPMGSTSEEEEVIFWRNNGTRKPSLQEGYSQVGSYKNPRYNPATKNMAGSPSEFVIIYAKTDLSQRTKQTNVSKKPYSRRRIGSMMRD